MHSREEMRRLTPVRVGIENHGLARIIHVLLLNFYDAFLDAQRHHPVPCPLLHFTSLEHVNVVTERSEYML